MIAAGRGKTIFIASNAGRVSSEATVHAAAKRRHSLFVSARSDSITGQLLSAGGALTFVG
jgi:hypothetical protein